MLQFTEYAQQVGLTVKQNFTSKVSSVYGSTRASSDAHRKPIEMVVIHTTANTAPAVNEAANLANNNGTNSFNAVADATEVYETVRFSDVSHHAGDKDINQRSIGIELVESNIEAGYINLVKYLGYVMAQLRLYPTTQTVRLHSEFVYTSCGSFYKNKGIGNIINDIIKYYSIAVSGTSESDESMIIEDGGSVKPGHTITLKGGTTIYKDVAHVEAFEDQPTKDYEAYVLWETPQWFKLRVQEFNPTDVWVKKDAIYGTALDVDGVARAVINGDYGNGQARYDKLRAEGYNPDEVQARVNEILG